MSKQQWIAGTLLVLTGCTPALSQTGPPVREGKPLAEILAIVQQRYAGRVVDIDLEHGPAGQRWYEIKMLNGERTTVYVDAVTGKEIAAPNQAAAQVLALPQVLRSLAKSHPGVVLEAELEGGQGEPLRYDIRILGAQGQTVEIRADARTGSVLKGPVLPPAAAADLLPLADLLEALEKRYKARVTEAELKFSRAQRPHYEIDLVLESGRSLEVHVDARTGKHLSDGAWDR